MGPRFTRVCKPGGKCVLMFRHDVLPGFAAKREAMVRRNGCMVMTRVALDRIVMEALSASVGAYIIIWHARHTIIIDRR